MIDYNLWWQNSSPEHRACLLPFINDPIVPVSVVKALLRTHPMISSEWELSSEDNAAYVWPPGLQDFLRSKVDFSDLTFIGKISGVTPEAVTIKISASMLTEHIHDVIAGVMKQSPAFRVTERARQEMHDRVKGVLGAAKMNQFIRDAILDKRSDRD